MKVLVTGAAGFIGMHCAERLAARGDEVIGLDNLSPYYSLELKEARLARLRGLKGFRFERLDLADRGALERLFAATKPDSVLHLAAQPGVRYSLENPGSYVQSNLVGFANLLECSRHDPPRHLVYASSSSVYGGNVKLPWNESDAVDHPVSLYAATKKSNELMAHVYSHLFGIPATGLRYFTVYGPWGRPDMSPILFARAIVEDRPIHVFNHGDMTRDFTYIDDAVEGTLRVLDQPAASEPGFDASAPDPATSWAPWRLYNVGNHRPVPLMDYIAALERALGKRARTEMMPMQPGDVQATCADTERLAQAVGFAPSTSLEQGLAKFARWFKSYYGYA
jgi:UDP-glucuronate 4-epimerase